MRWCRRFVVLAVLVFLTAPVGGRVAGAQERVRIPYRTYIGLNPAAVLWNFGSAELETGVAQGVTLGVGAAYTDVEQQIHASADLKLRYYPGEIVLRGLSVGLTGGYLRYSDVRGRVPTRLTIYAPTVGVVGDYNWMLGTSKRFVVGTGVGAKRVLANGNKRDPVGLRPVYVTGRFVVGLAF